MSKTCPPFIWLGTRMGEQPISPQQTTKAFDCQWLLPQAQTPSPMEHNLSEVSVPGILPAELGFRHKDLMYMVTHPRRLVGSLSGIRLQQRFDAENSRAFSWSLREAIVNLSHAIGSGA